MNENGHLVNILTEAPPVIRKYFGEKVELILELHRDCEEKWEKLFIIIKSPHEPDESFEREKAFLSEWFLDKLDETKGKLGITEESL